MSSLRRCSRLWLAPAAALLLACGGTGSQPTPASAAAPEIDAPASNVLRRDYVGSEACAGCHADLFASFRASPMRRMTRDLASTSFSAPFDGRSLALGEDEARLEEHEGQRFLRLLRPGSESLFRVTKVIGGRYREDFVGQEVSLRDPLGPALDQQRVLPVSYLRFDGTLRYKGYSVMVQERHGLEAGLVWQRACILCHNTAPQFVSLYDELWGGAGAPSYQGSASSDLPEDRSFRYVIDDADGLRLALADDLVRLGARGSLPKNPKHALEVAISNTRERYGEEQLVELGVGCESCHGGAREHASAPHRVRTSFAAVSSFFHVETASGSPLTPAQEQSRSCAKCHTVLFSRYPYTWEGGERRRNPGGSSTNSGEARDFLLGGCSTQLSCSSCHDPHGEDSPQRLNELAGEAGNRLCTGCHRELSDHERLRAHSHHAPGSAGSNCLDCHMPRKNMGLAYEFTRYHRIGSPTDPERVLGDRPPECALCHADRSVDQLISTMERWWGKRYDRTLLRRLYGADLRQNAVRLTLLGGRPHEQALAASLAVQARLPDASESILHLLGSDYPLVRYFARHSLEQALGRKLPLEMNLPGKELERAAREMLSKPPH